MVMVVPMVAYKFSKQELDWRSSCFVKMLAGCSTLVLNVLFLIVTLLCVVSCCRTLMKLVQTCLEWLNTCQVRICLLYCTNFFKLYYCKNFI